MECHSDIKKNKIISFAGKWMELEITTLSKISQNQTDKYHMGFFPHMWNLKKKRHESRRRNLVRKGKDQWEANRGINMIKIPCIHV
jgi:hypothetical protein